MRTLSVFTIVSLSNVTAGALLVTAISQTSPTLTWVLLGLALTLGVSTTAWAVLRFRKSLRQLSQQSELTDLIAPTTGIKELDEIALRFVKQLQAITGETVELKEMKNLLARLDRRKDEFDRDGLPIDCVTKFRAILKGCGGELDSNIRQAIACGREIHRATQEMVIGSEAQSDSVDQTTSFIEQLSLRIISVCDNAEEALECSTKAKNTAQSGLEQFQELVDEMKQIRNHAAARERKLQALGQHTKEIETIVQTIGTLSSRTDLLALNASIESVRAGEHGRGFAIVAEEVRALAEQSAQAVLDISRRIEMIQLETHQSISVASGEHDQMHGVIKRVTETLESLQHICDASNQSSEGLNAISTSTNQQLQLTREIVVALERNTESTRKNRSRAEGANWTAKSLGQIGQQLENSLEFFHLSGALEKSDSSTFATPFVDSEAVQKNVAVPAH